MKKDLQNSFSAYFQSLGLEGNFSSLIFLTLMASGIMLTALIFHILTKAFIRHWLPKLIKKTKTDWDNKLFDRGVFTRLAHLAPALVFYVGLPFLFEDLPFWSDLSIRLTVCYIVLSGLSALFAVLDAANDIYQNFPISKDRPIKSYLQVVKIILFALAGLVIVTVLLQINPVAILSSVGALSAVLLLVFKDSIMGLVASIQLSANNMVAIGDWIEMPKYGADGDVIDITLQTVRVQNFDKTIVTLPLYALVSDSFKNWRGMSESGGRRIKRAINIDLNSVKFLNKKELEDLKSYSLLKPYIEKKEDELAKFQQINGLREKDLLSGRALTNLGTFRKYVELYLRQNPHINTEMTFLVRQLPLGSKGIPIEVYVFANDNRWAQYEEIQADIFDYLLAVVPLFGLRVFQEPSGADFGKLTQAP